MSKQAPHSPAHAHSEISEHAKAPEPIPGSVRPLFCFSVGPRAYFRFFTIFLLVSVSINILGSSLFSFGAHPFTGIFQFLIDIIFLSLAAVCYSKFDDTGNYGQNVHVCFSIAMLVFALMSLLGSALLPVVLLIFGLGDTAAGWLNLKGRVTLWVLVAIYLLVVLPVMSFFSYLSYLYVRVVAWKRKQMQTLQKHERQMALTDHESSLSRV